MEAATQAIAAAGAGALRIDEIAARSSVNKRMIYHYFGNRTGLIDAVFAAQIAIVVPHLGGAHGRKALLQALALAPQQTGERSESAPAPDNKEALCRAAAIILCALLHKQWSQESPVPPSVAHEQEGLAVRLLALVRRANLSGGGIAGVEKPRYTVRSTSRPTG